MYLTPWRQSPYLEGDNCSGSLLQNVMVHYSIYRSPTLVCVLRISIYCSQVYLTSVVQYTSTYTLVSQEAFSLQVQTKFFKYLCISHATLQAHSIFVDLITLIISVNQYKLLLCPVIFSTLQFLHPFSI
jgi:hypothetical protein